MCYTKNNIPILCVGEKLYNYFNSLKVEDSFLSSRYISNTETILKEIDKLRNKNITTGKYRIYV